MRLIYYRSYAQPESRICRPVPCVPCQPHSRCQLHVPDGRYASTESGNKADCGIRPPATAYRRACACCDCVGSGTLHAVCRDGPGKKVPARLSATAPRRRRAPSRCGRTSWSTRLSNLLSMVMAILAADMNAFSMTDRQLLYVHSRIFRRLSSVRRPQKPTFSAPHRAHRRLVDRVRIE